jgi:hypothetical protein
MTSWQTRFPEFSGPICPRCNGHGYTCANCLGTGYMSPWVANGKAEILRAAYRARIEQRNKAKAKKARSSDAI